MNITLDGEEDCVVENYRKLYIDTGYNENFDNINNIINDMKNLLTGNAQMSEHFKILEVICRTVVSLVYINISGKLQCYFVLWNTFSNEMSVYDLIKLEAIEDFYVLDSISQRMFLVPPTVPYIFTQKIIYPYVDPPIFIDVKERRYPHTLVDGYARIQRRDYRVYDNNYFIVDYIKKDIVNRVYNLIRKDKNNVYKMTLKYSRQNAIVTVISVSRDQSACDKLSKGTKECKDYIGKWIRLFFFYDAIVDLRETKYFKLANAKKLIFKYFGDN